LVLFLLFLKQKARLAKKNKRKKKKKGRKTKGKNKMDGPMFGSEVRTLDFDRVLQGRVDYVKKGAVEREMNPPIPALGDLRAAAEERMWSTDKLNDQRLEQDVVGSVGASTTARMVNEAVGRSVATGINADYTRHSFEGTVGAPSASASKKRHENAVAVTRGADDALDVAAARGGSRATLGFAKHAEPTRRVAPVRTDHSYAQRPMDLEHGAAKFASVGCSGNRGDSNAEPIAGTRRAADLAARSEATRQVRAGLGSLVGSGRSVVPTTDRNEKSIAVRRVMVVGHASSANRATNADPDAALDREATRDARHASYTISSHQTALERGAEADARLEQARIVPHRVPIDGVAAVADRHGRIAHAERYAEGPTASRVLLGSADPRTDRVGATTAETVRFSADASRVLLGRADPRTDRVGATTAETVRFSADASRVLLGRADPRTDRVGASTAETVRFSADASRVLLGSADPRTDRVGVSTAETVRFSADASRVLLGSADPRTDRAGVSAPASRHGSVAVHRVSLGGLDGLDGLDGLGGLDGRNTNARPTTERVDRVFAAARASQVSFEAREARAPVETGLRPEFLGAVDVGRQTYTTPFDTGVRGGSNPGGSRVDHVFSDPKNRTQLGVDFRRGEMHSTRAAGSVGETKSSRVAVSAMEPTARAAPVLAHAAPVGVPTRGVYAREYEYDR
jgi:hypothetical protein